MAAYAKEEEEGEKAMKTMKERIESRKRELAEKKAAKLMEVRVRVIFFTAFLFVSL